MTLPHFSGHGPSGGIDFARHLEKGAGAAALVQIRTLARTLARPLHFQSHDGAAASLPKFSNLTPSSAAPFSRLQTPPAPDSSTPGGMSLSSSRSSC